MSTFRLLDLPSGSITVVLSATVGDGVCDGVSRPLQPHVLTRSEYFSTPSYKICFVFRSFSNVRKSVLYSLCSWSAVVTCATIHLPKSRQKRDTTVKNKFMGAKDYSTIEVFPVTE